MAGKFKIAGNEKFSLDTTEQAFLQMVQRKRAVIMAGNLQCQICCTFYSLTIALMLSHLLKVHQSDPHFYVKCNIPGCQRTFRNGNTYKSHLRRAHKEVDLHQPVMGHVDAADYVEEEDVMDFEIDDLTTGENSDIDMSDGEEGLYDRLKDRLEANKKMNASYLLSTKEAHSLTQKALDGIIDGSTNLVRNTVELIQIGVQNRLDSAGIDFDAVPGLSELFAEDHKISNPFTHVATKHKQAAYYAANFGLVVSYRVYSDRRWQTDTNCNDAYSYVVLLQYLFVCTPDRAGSGNQKLTARSGWFAIFNAPKLFVKKIPSY